GHLERQAIGENTTRMQYCYSTVLQSLGIEAAARHAIRREPQRGSCKACGIFEIARLSLKMMRTEIHTLGPDYSGERTHTLRTQCIIVNGARAGTTFISIYRVCLV